LTRTRLVNQQQQPRRSAGISVGRCWGLRCTVRSTETRYQHSPVKPMWQRASHDGVFVLSVHTKLDAGQSDVRSSDNVTCCRGGDKQNVHI
jgi:hypothetical protein